MQQTTREYFDWVVISLIRSDRERELLLAPGARLPARILDEADAAGLSYP